VDRFGSAPPFRGLDAPIRPMAGGACRAGMGVGGGRVLRRGTSLVLLLSYSFSPCVPRTPTFADSRFDLASVLSILTLVIFRHLPRSSFLFAFAYVSQPELTFPLSLSPSASAGPGSIRLPAPSLSTAHSQSASASTSAVGTPTGGVPALTLKVKSLSASASVSASASPVGGDGDGEESDDEGDESPEED
jgi:hypothetical protein